MSDSEILGELKKLGLRSGEASVYLALLKAGRCTVRKIKELTGLHRTGIYDFLEQLLNRGLIHYTTEAGCRHYAPTTPEKFQDMVDEQQDILNSLLPSLVERYENPVDELHVEIAKGKEGIKSLLSDIIRVGEDYVCIGVDEDWWNEQFSFITEQHLKKEKRRNIRWKAIAQQGAEFVYDVKNAQYRFISKDHLGPLHTVVYGNNVAIIIREPLAAITIRNESLAKAQRTQFKMLWDIASHEQKL